MKRHSPYTARQTGSHRFTAMPTVKRTSRPRVARKSLALEDVWEAVLSLKEATELGFARMEARFARNERAFEEFAFSVSKRFDSVDERFNLVDKRLDGVEKRLGSVEQRLGTIEKRVVKRRLSA